MSFLKGLFSSNNKENNTKISNLTDNEMVLHYLKESLSKININGEILNNELIIANHNLSIKGWVNSKTNHPNAVVIELNFTINQKEFESEIFEALAGLGENVEASIKNGTHSFVTGVLSAIIQSFDESHNPQIDFETEWNGNIRIWHPKVGPIQAQGKFDITKADENKIFNILKDDIKARIGDMRFYWIKVYVSRQPNGKIISQCTFNNEPFYEANEKIENYAQSWDSYNEFKGEKQYIVIRQCDKTWTPSKYSNQNMNNIIDQAIDIIEKCSSSSDYDNLFENINKVTKDIDLAFELYCFIPEIYCRIMIPQVQYSEEVIIVMPDETKKSMYLSQFNIYGKTKKRIFERFQSNFNKDKAQNILFISSNFKAINSALHQGSELENLITTPMMLTAPENYNPFR